MQAREMNLIIKENGVQERGSLYLGSVYDADRLQIKNQKGIYAVLTMGGDPECKVEFKSKKFIHITLQAYDHPNFKIDTLFDEAISFIHNNLKTTNVLVHCFAGVSRSSSVVIAYLMKYHKISLYDALSLVQSKRAIVKPNQGFMMQLKNFEASLLSVI